MLTRLSKWWDKFCCNHNLSHDNYTIAAVPCSMWRQTAFCRPQKVDGSTILKKCKRCGKITAWLTDGYDTQRTEIHNVLCKSQSLFDAYCDAEGSFVLER